MAPGRIVPQGQVRTIRSFEHGKIKRVAVEEGSAVRKGEVLIEFDTPMVDAEVARHTSELDIKASWPQPCPGLPGPVAGT